jgi:replicative DNA helicase
MTVKLLTSPEFAEKFYNDLTMRANDPDRYRLWSSGLRELDKKTGGIGRGWFIVIVARQKGGKTGLLSTLAINLAKQNVKILYVSLEMHYVQMGARIVSNISGVQLNSFRDANLTQEEWDRTEGAISILEKFPGFWSYGVRNFSDLRRITRKMHPDVVIIDYLGLVNWDQSDVRTRYQEITKISNEFKALTLPDYEEDAEEDPRADLIALLQGQAESLGQQKVDALLKELGDSWRDWDTAEEKTVPTPVTIITAVQTSQGKQQRGKLDATAPKDSGAPAEDADLLLVINDCEGADGKSLPHMKEISIAASRISADGEFTVGYNPHFARFYDDINFIQVDVNETLRKI